MGATLTQDEWGMYPTHQDNYELEHQSRDKMGTRLSKATCGASVRRLVAATELASACKIVPAFWWRGMWSVLSWHGAGTRDLSSEGHQRQATTEQYIAEAEKNARADLQSVVLGNVKKRI